MVCDTDLKKNGTPSIMLSISFLKHQLCTNFYYTTCPRLFKRISMRSVIPFLADSFSIAHPLYASLVLLSPHSYSHLIITSKLQLLPWKIFSSIHSIILSLCTYVRALFFSHWILVFMPKKVIVQARTTPMTSTSKLLSTIGSTSPGIT